MNAAMTRSATGPRQRAGGRRTVSDYDPILQQLEAADAASTERVRQMLYAEGRPDLVAALDLKLREINNGIYSARMCWHSISEAQRRALTAVRYSHRLTRIGAEYQHTAQRITDLPIYARTIRALCAHDLMAWDGGAFDPEAAAVITERGLFVLRHGPASRPE